MAATSMPVCYAYRQKYLDPASQFTKSKIAFGTALEHGQGLYDLNHNNDVSDTGVRFGNALYHGLQRQYGATALESI